MVTRPQFKDPRGGAFEREAKSLIEERKERFEKLNLFVSQRGGWLTSVPGDPYVRLETTEGSAIPDELRRLGFKLYPDPDGERILHSAITETYLIEGSTVPVVRRHHGLVRTLRFNFDL